MKFHPDWQPQMRSTPLVLEGQIVHIRRLSRKLAFIDFESRGATVATHPGGFELAVKPLEACDVLDHAGCRAMAEKDVTTTLKAVKLGDVVRVRGAAERVRRARSHGVVQLPVVLWQALPTVLERWSDRPGHATFAPRHPGAAGGHAAKRQRRDSDAPSSSSSSSSAELCKHWINTGACLKGDGCRFVHLDMSTAAGKHARRQWIVQRKAERLARQAASSAALGDVVAVDAKRHKGARADVFCDWLVGALGAAALAEGSGVLDIAGGRGDVSFELAVKHGIAKCTLVDPRPRKLSKSQRRVLKKRALGIDALGPQQRALFDAAWCDGNAALWRGASCVVGMHADEATECIVAEAVARQKPFAVVPCCVHPLSGASMSAEEWLDYLQAMHPAIKRTFLPFQGKNCVLWCFAYGAVAEAAADAEGGGSGARV